MNESHNEPDNSFLIPIFHRDRAGAAPADKPPRPSHERRQVPGPQLQVSGAAAATLAEVVFDLHEKTWMLSPYTVPLSVLNR
jgi:hypothetical protein